MLCFQNSYPDVFEDMLLQLGNTEDSLDNLEGIVAQLDPDASDDDGQDYFERWELSEYRRISLRHMLENIIELVKDDDSVQAGERLRNALVSAAVTSVRANAETDRNAAGIDSLDQKEFLKRIDTDEQVNQVTRTLLHTFIKEFGKYGIELQVSWSDDRNTANCSVSTTRNDAIQQCYLGRKILQIQLRNGYIRVLFRPQPRNEAADKVTHLRHEFEQVGFAGEKGDAPYVWRTGDKDPSGNYKELLLNKINTEQLTMLAAQKLIDEITA